MGDTVVAISATTDDRIVEPADPRRPARAHRPFGVWSNWPRRLAREPRARRCTSVRSSSSGRLLRPPARHHAALEGSRPPRRRDGGCRSCTRWAAIHRHRGHGDDDDQRPHRTTTATPSASATRAEGRRRPDDGSRLRRSPSPTCDAAPASGTSAVAQRPLRTSKLPRTGSRSDEAELPDGVALLGELGGGGVDLAARVVVDVEALDDRVRRRPCRCTGSWRSGPPARRRSRRWGWPCDTQSPSGVPSVHERMWSTAALAADAADDAPRASMIAAPRLATVGM